MEKWKTRKAINAPFHAHALTFSTYRRQPILAFPTIAEIFLYHLDAARCSLNFDIWAYVVMPEHVHVLICPRERDYKMAAILRAMKSGTARESFKRYPWLRERCRVNVREGREEYRFWEAGGGYDRNIFTTKAVWSEITYMHNNPVKRGLSEKTTEWRFSSAGAYAEAAVPTFIPVDICPWGIE